MRKKLAVAIFALLSVAGFAAVQMAGADTPKPAYHECGGPMGYCSFVE